MKLKLTDRLACAYDRYSHIAVPTILFLALLLRTAALLSLSKTVYFDFLLWDERVYHVWAMKIADGTYQSLSFYGFAPLPAYIMAFVYKIFSPDILYVRILNIIFGVLACYLVYLIGKEMANRGTGLVACLIACLYEPFIFYSIVPLKTSMSVFLFALSVYFLVAVLNKHSMIKVFLMGAAIALMLKVRPNCVILIPFLPLIILLHIYKGKSSLKMIIATLLIYIAGLCIAISPFMIRNYQLSGKFAPVPAHSGFALYLGNNLGNSTPYYRPVPFASSSPFIQGSQFMIESSRRAGKKLSTREASSLWTHETIKIALEQPAAVMWKICQKTLALFNKFEAGDHYHIGFISDFAKFFKLPLLSLWLILPLGIAGIAINIFRSKKMLSLCAIFFLYGLTLIVSFPTSRFRLPLLIILIPSAVVGVNNLLSSVKSRQLKKSAVYSAMAIGFFIVEFLPVNGTGDMTAYYNTHALILSSKGLKDEAIPYWEISSSMNKPFSSFANLSLAEAYLRMRDREKALAYLDKIPDSSFAAADKYALKGDFFAIQRQIQKAISAYERSLEINSGGIKVRQKLIRIYRKTDKKRALQEYKKLQYIASFYKRH